MALNKYAALRYRIIDTFIRSRSKPYPTKEDLRQACEEALYGTSDGSHISISTIEKDLWTLRNESTFGYAPIIFDTFYKGYYYSDPEFSINLPLTVEDISMIRLAMGTLNHFRNSQLFSDLENAVSKIEGRLNLAQIFEESEPAQYIQFESIQAFKGNERLPILVDAIRNQIILKLSYQPHVDSQPRHYQVHAYLLKEYKNLWYLVGLETGAGKVRTLAVDRITNLEVIQEKFVSNLDFDPDLFFKHSFGIGIYSGVPVQVILEFEAIQGKYVENQPLHPTQEVISKDDLTLTVCIEVIPSTELIMQLLSYGPKVQVIKPESLRTEVAELHKKASRQYDLTAK